MYSQEQSKRGRASYDGKCASCHDGGTMGPELWGDAFLTQWENKDVGGFFTRIQTTMPEDAPGSLGEKRSARHHRLRAFRPTDSRQATRSIESAKALATMKFVTKK